VNVTALDGAIIFSLSSAAGCMYGIDISCSAFGWLGDIVFAAFFVVFFVSGLGGMAIVDTICDTLSSHVPLGRKTHLSYLAILIGSVAGLGIFLSGRGAVLGPGTAYVFLGAELATV